MPQLFKSVWVVIFACWLTACGDPLDAKIDNQIQFVDMQLKKLEQAINKQQIRNANLIKEYAQQVSQAKPQLQSIANELAKDATTQGPLYQSLNSRYQEAAKYADLFASKEERLAELQNLYQAADTTLFNDALSDPLNVLADMSDGLLPRVNAVSRAASLQANQAQDFGDGSQLIGNPAYGQWSTGSNGMSFWEWYGMYALISNLTDRRVYYNDWAGRRDYSYYNDYGRYRYSSPKQMRTQSTIESRAQKSFKGGQFKSAYAKPKVGATSISTSSRTAQNAANKFTSAYAKPKSTFSNSSSQSQNKKSTFGQSSFRSSSSGFSRGGFGGK
ncbi:hypothetical protein ACMZOO_09640 [Catenovulum sp. SX2]|uniref:hypothetical protein n=1 Tax=Catenovulum sp. SX2 TaxID=3398614 RepID=UPI003F844414